MALIQMIYASAARAPFSAKQLAELLAVARTRNSALDVSGLLLYAEGSFLQVLEGEAAVVESLYTKISADPRHHRVMMLGRGEVESRAFGAWSMGFLQAKASELAAVPGFNRFMQGDAPGVLVGDASRRVTEVLATFRSGRWRQFVEG